MNDLDTSEVLALAGRTSHSLASLEGELQRFRLGGEKEGSPRLLDLSAFR